MSKEHLATYLNDHLAGSQAAVEILERLGRTGAALKVAIEEDCEVLKNLMAQLNISESPIRKAGGWLGEKVIALKTRIDDKEGGALNQLETLEALALGIDGKLALWWALEAAKEVEPELAILEYETLILRALDQRSRVEELRLDAARVALSLAARDDERFTA
jgi:hypothetical protein